MKPTDDLGFSIHYDGIPKNILLFYLIEQQERGESCTLEG
jgi:hypothetical protein